MNDSLTAMMKSRYETIKQFEQGLENFKSFSKEVAEHCSNHIKENENKTPNSEYGRKLHELDMEIQELKRITVNHGVMYEERQLQHMKDMQELLELIILYFEIIPELKGNREAIDKFDNLRKRIEPRWDLLEQNIDKATKNFEKRNGDSSGI